MEEWKLLKTKAAEASELKELHKAANVTDSAEKSRLRIVALNTAREDEVRAM